MILVFWICCLLISYTYFGYPILIWLLARLRPYPTKAASITPSVTLIIPAYNEERWIQRKIENALALDYPREQIEILVVSGGSTDKTVEIAKKFATQGVQVIPSQQRMGKIEILNYLVPGLNREIVMVSDANALLQPDALRTLVRHFADPEVACVTGRRTCIVQEGISAAEGESLYWRYEAWIKSCESLVSSCLGGHGQLYAVRRSVFPRVELSDDFYVPMKIIEETSLRVIYEPGALCAVPAAASLSGEFKRKVRSHATFLLILPRIRKLLVPRRTTLWWQFVSHHIFRQIVPIAMVGLLLVSLQLAGDRGFYLFALLAQFVFYGLALAGYVMARSGHKPKILYVPFYFAFANLAVVFAAGFAWFHDYDRWERTERLTSLG